MTNVVFSPHAYRMQSLGGVSRYVTELAGALRKVGVYADVLAYLHSNSLARGAGRGVDVSALRPRKLRQALTLSVDTLLEQMSPTRRRADVYHFSYYPRIRPTNVGGVTAVTVYDMIHERYPADFDKADHTSEWKRRLCSSADVIFAISEATKGDIVDVLGIPSERITVTRLGPSSLSVIPRQEPGRPLLLFVGDRRRRYKNFAAALRGLAAVEGSTEVELHCVGGGALTGSETDQIHRLGLTGRVHATEVTDEGLAALYSRAYALVVTSRCEGFGLPLVEAMQAGCPIVRSRAPGIDEVAGDAAITFDPDSVDELASALTAVVTDHRLRNELTARGRSRVAAFSWEQCALATRDGYRRAGA